MPTKTPRISPYTRKCKNGKVDIKVEVDVLRVDGKDLGKDENLLPVAVLRVEEEQIDSDIETIKPFPRSMKERSNFQNLKTNRKVTDFQFRVYDLCSQIPPGWFSTYKAISDALRASPRAVGQALRNNPFAPLPVPCHRVLSSSCFIGGFDGDWGSGNKINSKRAKLEKEGLAFDKQQVLLPVFQNTRLFTNFKL
ncbi:hypothetical protein K7432_006618 [Basidiobolus ranarum]|uniref:Methylated-DNA--protein-cysteine methyltransferase n=1 Tax=Basidiobolus ranarum TaxID=34480 RepID=A0ABR2WUT3_9FUNG